MNPIEHESDQAQAGGQAPAQAPAAAPLLAAVEREIQERCEALDELETAWLDALLARDFALAQWLADCSREHCKQVALAREELERCLPESRPGEGRSTVQR